MLYGKGGMLIVQKAVVRLNGVWRMPACTSYDTGMMYKFLNYFNKHNLPSSSSYLFLAYGKSMVQYGPVGIILRIN